VTASSSGADPTAATSSGTTRTSRCGC
jgi:hypothetical protein